MWPSPRRCVLVLVPVLVAVLVAGLGGRAHAQLLPDDADARPTRGVFVTGGARTGDADATALELNPGALGLLPAPSFALAADIWGENTPLPGRGAGFFLGAPVIGHSALGVGLQFVGSSPAVGVQSHTKFQLGYALRFGRNAGLGVTWAHLWRSAADGVDTFDIGLSLRPLRYLALGAVVEDVGDPRGLPRLWAGELVLRPLGTDRLEIAAGASHVQDQPWSHLSPRGRLAALLTDGLRLYGEGEIVPRVSPTGTATAFESHADYRFSVGLAIDIDHVGLTAALRGGIPGSGDNGFGAATVLRVSGERRAPVLAPAVVARVSFDGVHNDRDYLALVQRLRALAADRDVAAVLLKIENLELGLGRIEEVRDLVAGLRARGKRVFAYAPFPSTRDYYLASACDTIVLHPAGELSLNGLSQTVTFYKGAMDRFGVNVDLVRIAEFKGAMEPFVMTEHSPPVRANKNEVLDDVFRRIVAAVASTRSRAGRTISEADVRAMVDRGLFTPAEAQVAGLVDAIKSEADLEEFLRQALGGRRIVLRDPDPGPVHPRAWPSRRVAVVLVDGAIVDGPSQQLPFGLESLAGSDTLLEALEECRRDPSVGAVVLRVNSPGGSAFASDVIARAIGVLRKAGKPVVVSMGDVAASGGYYIAAPAEAIFAEPSTISGSIGIFAYKVDVRRLMGSFGLSSEVFRRGVHADYLSPYRPWTDAEIKMVADKIKHFYGMFLDTVAEGRRARGITLARADELGRGRIYTGSAAMGVGLVDQMGGLGAAIDRAARLAGAPLGADELPELTVLPRSPSSALEKLIGLAGQADQAGHVDHVDLGPATARAAVRLLAPLLFGGGASGVQARMPYDLDIR
jgi:protease-4